MIQLLGLVIGALIELSYCIDLWIYIWLFIGSIIALIISVVLTILLASLNNFAGTILSGSLLFISATCCPLIILFVIGGIIAKLLISGLV